jgi:hypothetical protein
LVKEGYTVKNYKLRDGDPDTIRVSSKVYFPEVDDDGNVDLGNWCLTKSEAEFKEKWLSFNRKLSSEYERLEQRKKEFWKLTSEELGLPDEPRIIIRR